MRTLPALATALCCLTLASACSGQGKKLGAFLGDTSDRMEQGLTEADLAKLPALTKIDVDKPLTEADYKLYGDHLQAFIVNIAANHCLNADSTKVNTLVNRYRFDVGQLVDDLKSGAKTPDDTCRFLGSIRLAVVNDLKNDVLTGGSQKEFVNFWDLNESMWKEVGYPGGPPEVGEEAVREIGITGPQAAQIIEIWAKCGIEFSRLVNPTGAPVTKDSTIFENGPESNRAQCEAIGMKYWNQMMAVFTPDQTTKAWAWWNRFSDKMDNYANRHRDELEANSHTETVHAH